MLRNGFFGLAAATSILLGEFSRADDWPQWFGPQRDGVWRETGIIKQFPEGGPKIRWRAKVGGGYAGAAVVGDKVFITDRQLKDGASDPASPFNRGSTPATERVLCLSDADGSTIWKHEYDCPYTVSYPAGPRTTPTVDGDYVYTLGAEGHLFCLSVKDGKPVWSKQLVKDYGLPGSPVWGFAAHPLIDGDRLICLVGGQGTAVVAFDKRTGKEQWRALDAVSAHGPGYCPPIIIEHGGARQLIVFHPAGVTSLNPEDGQVIWNQDWEINNGLTIPVPRLSGDELFLTTFYDGSMMLKLGDKPSEVTQLWKRRGKSERNTDALHCIMSTPWFENGLIFGVDSYGELRGLDAKNGDRLWQTFEATDGKSARWANAFIVKHEDRFFLPNEQGDLIIAKMDRAGYHEVSRAHLVEPTGEAQGRKIVWSHPAFANRCVYQRNDEEIVCVSLAAE
jgi:outer membrane protein assembly factor BamB